MRERGLLCPRRVRHGGRVTRNGTITTDAPDVMWSTDGTRVLTAEERCVWVFAAAHHLKCEEVGHHVCKRRHRVAARQPVAQGLMRRFGSVTPDAGRWLALRMAHGRQYVSDHICNQVGFWGVEASCSFVEQPQGNGVSERFFRTMKEQVIYGRVYRTTGEVREAVDTFVALFNTGWRPEKDGFRSPSETRRAYHNRRGQQAAA